MNIKLLLEYSIFADCFIGAAVLILMIRKRMLGDFYCLAALVAIGCLEDVISIPLLFFRKAIGVSAVGAYDIYFYSHVVISLVEYGLLLLVIYSVFRQAMKPLEGLHRAGKIVFRWIAGVSVALSAVLALGPHAGTALTMATLTSQVQQGVSVLTLCLLLFVCFSTRYLGLTYRSHIFGVTLGLGIFAMVSLVESAWTVAGPHTVYNWVFVFSTVGSCVALMTWATYFALPQPERKMILLPTTSPFFLWNRISEALGDEPGFVAIAGFKPEMLAPAEMAAFTAGSKRAREREIELDLAARVERETEAALASAPSMGIHSIAMQR